MRNRERSFVDPSVLALQINDVGRATEDRTTPELASQRKSPLCNLSWD